MRVIAADRKIVTSIRRREKRGPNSTIRDNTQSVVSFIKHPTNSTRRTLHKTYLRKSKCCPCSFSGEKTFMMPPMRPADEDDGVPDDGEPSFPAAPFSAPEPSRPGSPFPEEESKANRDGNGCRTRASRTGALSPKISSHPNIFARPHPRDRTTVATAARRSPVASALCNDSLPPSFARQAAYPSDTRAQNMTHHPYCCITRTVMQLRHQTNHHVCVLGTVDGLGGI